MIQYRFPEEPVIMLHYARLLKNSEVEIIVQQGQVTNKEQAKCLAKFFWQMIDQMVIDRDNKVVVEGQADLEAWGEYIFESVRSYLHSNGYANEWEMYAE